MLGLIDIYWTTARQAVMQQFQYRTANYIAFFGSWKLVMIPLWLPLRALMIYSLWLMALAAAVGAGMLLLARIVWRTGMRRYAGASA